MGLQEINNGYEGYNTYCGGTICVYHKFKWQEWNKRTPRIAEKNRKKENFLKRKQKYEQLK